MKHVIAYRWGLGRSVGRLIVEIGFSSGLLQTPSKSVKLWSELEWSFV